MSATQWGLLFCSLTTRLGVYVKISRKGHQHSISKLCFWLAFGAPFLEPLPEGPLCSWATPGLCRQGGQLEEPLSCLWLQCTSNILAPFPVLQSCGATIPSPIINHGSEASWNGHMQQMAKSIYSLVLWAPCVERKNTFSDRTELFLFFSPNFFRNMCLILKENCLAEVISHSRSCGPSTTFW